MSDFKRFDVVEEDDITILRLSDEELSELSLQEKLNHELLNLLESRNPKKLVVNFEPVRFCTTAVIETLIRVKKRVVANDGQLKLCALSPHVREAFKILNLDGTVFQITETESEAIAAFS